MDFRDQSIAELTAMVGRREVSARELVQAALDRIAAQNGALNAFVCVDGERALADAAGVDERIARGEQVGPLAGIPLAVKDVEGVRGYRTTHGSAALAQAPVASTDSVLVSRLRAAGCVVVGKTNTPEFSLKPTTDNPLFGVTGNPWNPERTPGGSSGGSAAAVAAGIVPLATASDGGGSIRTPSAVCGLPGFKPSLGQVPGTDVAPPGWPNLSTRGVLAHRVSDLRLALEVSRGPDPFDLRSLPSDGLSWVTAPDTVAPPRRVAWSPTLGFAEVDREVLAGCLQLVESLANQGCEVVEIEQVFDQDPSATLVTLVGAFILRSVAPFRDTPQWTALDPVIVMTAELARLRDSNLDMVRAIDSGHRLNQQLVQAMDGFDLLLCPTTCGQAPPASMPARVSDVLEALAANPEGAGGLAEPVVAGLMDVLADFTELNLPMGTVNGVPTLDWTRMTSAFNLTGSPVGTAFAGLTGDGMPIGLQVIGPRHADVRVLAALTLLEQLGADRPARAPER